MKKFIVILYVLFLLTGKVFSAGSTGGDTKSNYDQAVKLIKSAKKSEEKGKKIRHYLNMKERLNF